MSLPLVLAIDTSFGPVGVALATFDGRLLACKNVADAAGKQTEILPPLVQQAFVDAGARVDDVARVVVTVGPGAFTGIRVGLAFAKGIKVATGALVLGVSSLECLAVQVLKSSAATDVAVVIDARRSEVYAYGVDEFGQCWLPPCLVSVGDANRMFRERASRRLLVAGSGGDFIDGNLGERLLPNIAQVDVAALALRGSTLGATLYPPIPAYLREPDARLPA